MKSTTPARPARLRSLSASTWTLLASAGLGACFLGCSEPATQESSAPEKVPAPEASAAAPTAEAAPAPVQPAAAPKPTAAPVATGPVEVPSDPEGMIKTVAQSFLNKKPRVIWDALPSSYQTDIQDILKLHAETADPSMWNKGFAMGNRIVGVLKEKKEFILNTPSLATNPDIEKLRSNWDDMVGIFDTVLSSDISKLETIKQMDVAQFLDTTGTKVLQNIEALAQVAGDGEFEEMQKQLQGLTTKVLESGTDTAKLEIQIPGEEPKVSEFTKVADKWVPAELAEGWETNVSMIKEQMAAQKEATPEAKMGQMMIMGMIEGIITPFESAKSQEEFNMAIGNLMQMAGGMMGGGMGGPGAPGAPPQLPKLP